MRQLFKYLLLGFVYFYQWVISPLTMSSCRHVPTCSQYMTEAIRQHGPGKGFLLSMNRLSRCHPWGTHGYDPVPKFVVKKYRPSNRSKPETRLKEH
ncbi:MAG: membrane protein insertion efficiency factor YidD [Bacteroidales bacterium]|nr:membrane protein insertion efficiency factor YidD [Bacteroidales bacterium]